MPLGVDEAAEQCNSFVFLPEPRGRVRSCLDPSRLNQALICRVHKDLH